MRILAILQRYPQLSETYIATELRILARAHEISIVSLEEADLPKHSHLPFRLVREGEKRLHALVKAYQPDVIHGHYIHNAPLLYSLAKRAGLSFTVVTHSYDVLKPSHDALSLFSAFLNNRYCLGVLALPFAVPKLSAAGVRIEKVHDTYPIVDFERFHDRSRNGSGIMNVGAALPKKAMDEFLRFACQIKSKPVRLYAMGYGVLALRRLNEELNNPAEILDPIQHEHMPKEYKRHDWLVYSASRSIGTVGWPMAIAEAQAAGLCVCIPRVRDDLLQYVGEGGFVLDTLAEAVDIVQTPPSHSMREAAFEQARRSDAERHVQLLEQLWSGRE